MASSDSYLRRVVNRQMAAKLLSVPVVLVEGARGSTQQHSIGDRDGRHSN